MYRRSMVLLRSERSTHASIGSQAYSSCQQSSLYFLSSTRFGSTIRSSVPSGRLSISTLRNSDFPDPVRHATIMCGVLLSSRSRLYTVQSMSFPIGIAPDSYFSKLRSVRGTSTHTYSVPGTGASMRTFSIDVAWETSSAYFRTSDILTPLFGLNR